jgi:branched-chain amino acid transport system permease protein
VTPGAAAGPPPPARETARPGRGVVVGWGVFLALQLALPALTGNGYALQVIDTMAVYVLLAMSMNILLGFVGQIAFGHAGFPGLGAYTTALLAIKAGWSFWLAFPASCLVAGAVGLVVGVPALLVRGHYLAMVTLGFGEILRLLMLNWHSVTNGPNGLYPVPPARPFGVALGTETGFFYLAWVVLVAGQVVSHRLRYSRTGRAMLAVKHDELAASVAGIPVARIKLLGFFVSALFAGAAGSLFAYFLRYVNPDSFTIEVSVNAVMMVILGGVGHLASPWIGAVVLVGLGEYLRFLGHYREIFFGLIILLILIFMPNGIAALVAAKVRRPRAWGRAAA